MTLPILSLSVGAPLSELDDDVCRFLGDLSDPLDDLLFLSAQ